MGRQMAFILRDEQTAFDMSAMVAAIRARYPSLPVEVVAGSAADAPLIQCDGELVAVMNIPVAMPHEDETGDLWARAARIWPDASAVGARHCAHVIVAVAGKLNSALREARLVTAVVGGVLDVTAGCTAVIWSEHVVRPAARWKEKSRSAMADYPNYPILLWVDLLPVKSASGGDVLTVGLSSFIEREIEFQIGRLDLSHVLSTTAGLASYLIEHGDVIKDGDTVGGSDGERILARHTRSAHYDDRPVLRIAAE